MRRVRREKLANDFAVFIERNDLDRTVFINDNGLVNTIGKLHGIGYRTVFRHFLDIGDFIHAIDLLIGEFERFAFGRGGYVC